MKRLVSVIMLFALIGLYSSGCASAYNTHRVTNKIATSRILASGDANKIALLKENRISPKDVIKLSPVGNDGFKVTVDLADLEGIRSWWTAAKAAPVSTGVSAILDGIMLYYSIDAVSDQFDEDEAGSTELATDLKTGSVTVQRGATVGGNVDTISGNVVIGENARIGGSINTAPPAEEK